MLQEIIEFLACPVCGEELVMSGSTVACENRHSFDVARQGYLNLLAGEAPLAGDTAAMLDARSSLLSSGLFAPLTEAVVRASVAAAAESSRAEGVGTSGAAGSLAVDAGAGTGHYLAAVLDALPGWRGVALDVSKHAARRAAKAHPSIGSVVADTWQALPLADSCASLVLDVFAPRNAAEFRRVLRPNGALIVATPTERHLAELVEATGMLSVDASKEERLGRALDSDFVLTTSENVEAALSLTRSQANAIAMMGPSAHHPDQSGEALAELEEPFETRLSVRVAVYSPRPASV